MADRIVVMDRGRIEQVGRPVEIYREPASPFVADFIGSMNFIEGTVAGPDTVRIGGLGLRTRARGLAGRVTLAIRPEDVEVQEVSAGRDNAVLVRIRRLEFLGSFFRAHLETVEQPGLALRADLSVDLLRRTKIEEAQALWVALPAERLRVYAKPDRHGVAR